MIKIIYEKDEWDGYVMAEVGGEWIVRNGNGKRFHSRHSTKAEADAEALRENRIDESIYLIAKVAIPKLEEALQNIIYEVAEVAYPQLFEKWNKEGENDG
jgi:hypothetical protein